MKHANTILKGLLLAVMLWTIGGFCLVAGVDMTVRGRTAGGGSSRVSGKSSSFRSDKTGLYGPGIAILGLSVVAAGGLVIPTGLLHEQGKLQPWWGRITIGWRCVQAGLLIGFGFIIVSVVASEFF